jgi:WD40 repeat protein
MLQDEAEAFEAEASARRVGRQREGAVLFDTIFTPDGLFLLCGSSTGEIYVWDVRVVLSGRGAGAPRSFRGHQSSVHSLLITPDGSVLVSGSASGVRSWCWQEILGCLDRGEAPAPSHEFTETATNGLAFDTHGGVFFAASGDNCCHAYDLGAGTETAALKGHTNYLHAVLVMGQSRQVVTAAEDGCVRLWDMRSGLSATRVLEPFGSGGTDAPPDISAQSAGVSRRLASATWASCLACDETENWLVRASPTRPLPPSFPR